MRDYTTIPPKIREALDRYAKEHIAAGHFVMAVLRNDLMSAVFRADDQSLAALAAIVCYCYNELPSTCWGSPDKVTAWLLIPGDTLLKDIARRSDELIERVLGK